MKKAHTSQIKSNIFKDYDTGEDSHFDSSPAFIQKKNIIALKYIFNHGLKSSTLIYYGCIVKSNCPIILQSVEELAPLLVSIKKLAIEFRKFENVDIHGIECVGQLVGLLNENKTDTIFSPSHSKVVQTLVDENIIYHKKTAKDLTTSLRQLSFKLTKFSTG